VRFEGKESLLNYLNCRSVSILCGTECGGSGENQMLVVCVKWENQRRVRSPVSAWIKRLECTSCGRLSSANVSKLFSI